MGELHNIIKGAGGSMADFTVMSNLTDPYRLDTPANHRDAQWVAEAFACGGLIVIHCRGFHYTIVSMPKIRKPNGEPYLNTDENWVWLQRVTNIARWLGYIDFEAISDERNAAPELWLPPEFEDGISISHEAHYLGLDIELPRIRVKCTPPHARQAYRIVIIGEKSSLGSVLRPICRKYEAEMILPTGELSTTLLHGLVKRAAEDGRPTKVFYLSDFDPSGLHMPVVESRKIQALCDLKYPGLDIEVHRCALLADQVQDLDLPETPIKETEKRAAKWRERFNCEQTEIDALATLRPAELVEIVEANLKPYFDDTLQRRQRQAYEVTERAIRERIKEIEGEYQDQLGHAQSLIDTAAAVMAEAQEFCEPLFDVMADRIDLDLINVDEALPVISEVLAEPLFSSMDDFVTATLKLREAKL